MPPAAKRGLLRLAQWLLLANVFVATAAIATAQGRVFTDADKGASVQLRNGESFEIHLKSNPSTGYEWSIAPESTPIVRLTAQSHATPPAQPGVGRPIVQVFGFQAVHHGQGVLLLHYARSWEKPGASEQRFDLHLTVR